MTPEERIAQLEAELARERARADGLQEIVHALVVKGTGQPDLAWPIRRRVTAKPEALAWSRLHPGVPLPPTQPEPIDDGVDIPPFEIRLRTPEEQAAYLAEEEKRMAPIRAERAEQARLRARRWVYFIQAGDAGPIKIGISRDVSRRRGELQRMEREPLHIRATIEGTPRDERDLHARFAEHRLHGEWFSPAPELLSHINAMNGVKS